MNQSAVPEGDFNTAVLISIEHEHKAVESANLV